MAAVIGVQDSLQHVGPQLWFLQTLLGHATAVMHTLAQRSLQHFSPDNQGILHVYLPSNPQYASATVLEAGRCNMVSCLCMVMLAVITCVALHACDICIAACCVGVLAEVPQSASVPGCIALVIASTRYTRCIAYSTSPLTESLSSDNVHASRRLPLHELIEACPCCRIQTRG